MVYSRLKDHYFNPWVMGWLAKKASCEKHCINIKDVKMFINNNF